VTEWTLRSCCAEFLGMSPTRYVLLRRLSRARVALRDTVPGGANLVELVRGFGFAELGRFEAAYLAAFGEPPLTTLQRAPERGSSTRKIRYFCIAASEPRSLGFKSGRA